MKKYTILLSLFICFNKIVAQDCPQGYEERTVKCNGRFEKKCIPVNYSCNQCWAVNTVSCPGVKLPGLDFYNSFEKAFAVAERDKNTALRTSNYKCMGNDPRKYTIYLDDSKSCNGGSSGLSNDLKNKILAFLKRYQTEIKNYKRYFSGQPYRPGAVTKEYQSVLKEAEENANRLSLKLNSLTDENLFQFESEFENIKNDETKLIQAASDYKNSISNSSTSNTVSAPSSHNVTTQNEQNNAQLQNQLNTIVKRNNETLEKQRQRTKEENERFNAMLSGIFDVLQKSDAIKYMQKLEQNKNEKLNYLKNSIAGGNYELLPCGNCNSTGTLSHKPCNGTGKINCSVCAGSGVGFSGSTCSLCSGKGFSHCTSGCSGTGIISCYVCSGTGMKLSSIAITNLTSNITRNTEVSMVEPNLNRNKVENFHSITIDGNIFSLENYPNKSFLIVFWSTANEQSLREYKRHCLLTERYQENDIILIGIAIESSKYQWTSKVNENNLTGINLSDLNSFKSKLLKHFGVESIPFSIFINKDRNVMKQSQTINIFSK